MFNYKMTLGIMASMLLAFDCAAAVVHSGTDGNISWSISDDGALTISGTGAMKSEYKKPCNTCAGSQAPWYQYNDSITSINIESGVTTLADRAFRGLTNVTSVNIAPTVTKIGNTVFEENTSLTNVTIPSSVTSIGDWAFKNTASLTSITIPSSVQSIGKEAFAIDITKAGGNGVLNQYKYESSLQTLVFEEPSSLTSIGSKAFQGTKSLTSVTLPSGITTINDHAFEDAVNMVSLTIPSTVTSISEGAFSHAESLTTIDFGENMQVIGDKAFAYTYALTSLTIPDSVTTIGTGTFVHATSLTELVLGENLTSLGKESFNDTPSLTKLTIGPNLTSIGKDAFKSAPITELTIDPESSAETLTLIKNFFKTRTNPKAITKINCLDAERSACTEALASVGWDISSIPGERISSAPAVQTPDGPTWYKNADGSSTLYNEQGEPIAFKGKRIFTIEEANIVAGRVNHVRLRFK